MHWVRQEVNESSPQYWNAPQVCLPLDTLIGCHYNVPDLLSDFSANPKCEVECVFFRCRAGKRPHTASAKDNKGRPRGRELSLCI